MIISPLVIKNNITLFTFFIREGSLVFSCKCRMSLLTSSSGTWKSKDTKESTNLFGIEHSTYAALPDQFAAFLTKLYSEGIFTGRGSHINISRVMSMDSYSMATCVAQLHQRISKLSIGCKYLPVYPFGCGNNHRFDPSGQHILQGIELWIYKSYIELPVDQFKATAKTLLDALVQGWEQSSLSLHSEIFHRESENTHQLYVKKMNEGMDDTFIRHLAIALDAPRVSCYDTIKDSKGVLTYGDFMYMWKPKAASKSRCLNQ
jgi:hypothetical protein